MDIQKISEFKGINVWAGNFPMNWILKVKKFSKALLSRIKYKGWVMGNKYGNDEPKIGTNYRSYFVHGWKNKSSWQYLIKCW